ncbi:MAG: hypothetical protein AABX13_05325 [Nanoarchaeota archaeon]
MERKELLVVVLIGVLLITVALQTVQLTGLSKSGVVVKTASGPAPAVAASGGGGAAPTVPTSLQNLPSMVGGC